MKVLLALFLMLAMPALGFGEDLDEALLSAVWGKRVEVVKVLAKVGANVDAKDEGGRTPLHHATNHGQVKIVKVLLKAGASPTPRTRTDRRLCGWQ